MKKKLQLLSVALCIAASTFAQYNQQHAKITPVGLAAKQAFGSSVSLSADASTAIVGAWGGISGATGQAVIIRRNSDNTWSQDQILVGTDAIGGANQGNSVAISADGNTAIVGGPGDNGNAGAAWVFTRSGSTWTQQAKLIGTGATGNAFQGYSVAISDNGNIVVIGGPGDNNTAGAAWVFARSGANWTQSGTKLLGSGGEGFAGYQQGFSVTIAGNGNTVAIGAPYQGYGNQGAVWIYALSGGNWVQEFLLTGEVSDNIGTSLACSNDGSTLVVGAARNFDYVGGAYVAKKTGTVWTPYGQVLRGSLAVGSAQQGGAVSISSDGNTIVIGGGASTFSNNATISVGASWVFKYDGANWNQEGNKYVGTNNIGNSQQGKSVSMSADGNTFITGGFNDNDNTGAIWVFSKTIPVPTSVNNAKNMAIQIQIYPNPAQDKVNIVSDMEVSNEWCNIYGRCVISRNQQTEVDIFELPAGLYLLNLYDKNGNKIQTKKILKK